MSILSSLLFFLSAALPATPSSYTFESFAYFTHIKRKDSKRVETHCGRTELRSKGDAGKSPSRANARDQAGVGIEYYDQDQVGVPNNHHG